MYKLIETSENIEYSLPVIGANIITIIKSSKKRMTVYELLNKISKNHPSYGENRVMQSLVFLYAINAIDLKEPYIEVSDDN
ncbi:MULTISPECIES: ABC-three component system middle component 6 [Photobacterium]|uniref:ABC-three component system middle component 6 n=1 Tax=Photobacterium TaxID=657 RepID=UPI000D179A27|nr:ABC-three component system middle component 6 [Photobacterium leiognathi]PSW56842.1 hypothetical protein C0W50_10890 [Photobacterium leiognathi subsp. mandapamensis]